MVDSVSDLVRVCSNFHNSQSYVDLCIELSEGATLCLLALSGLAGRLEASPEKHGGVVSAEQVNSDLEAAIAQEGLFIYECMKD